MLQFTKVFEKNAKAWKDDEIFYVINQGGTSSSKTFSILQLLTFLSIKYPLQIDIVGLSVPHLKSGVLNDMPAICRQMGINFDNNFRVADRQFKVGVGCLNFLAFDKLGKAHGGRRDILYLNEANHLHYKIVEQLIIRTRKKVFIDYNPTSAFWAHNHIIANENEKTKFIQSTYADNRFLEQNIIDMIEAKKGDGTNNFWRVYGLGELGVAEGLIFNNFVLEDFDKFAFADYYNGNDWGFSVDPFAFVRVAVQNDTLYICDEIYQKNLLNNESAALVKPLVKEELLVADSAEPKSIQDFVNAGIWAVGAKKGAGSIEYGIKKLQSFKKIVIHPDCKNTYSEFCNYQWAMDKNGEPTNKPIDAFNHAIDAIRYALENYSLNETITFYKNIVV